MPARTRLVKQVAAIFIVFVLGILLIQPFKSTEIKTYDLSNEIATNTDNTGRQLAEVDLKSVAGETISTRSLLGTPTIINIWYSTCEPCRRELPVLASGAQKYAGIVNFVGINIKDSAKVATEFAQKYGADFAIYLDDNGRFISKTGISTAPVTLAINAQGLVVSQTAGELSASKLDQVVTELLK